MSAARPVSVAAGAAVGVLLVGWMQAWSPGRLAACGGTTFVLVDGLALLLARSRPGSASRWTLLAAGLVIWIAALAYVSAKVP